MLRVSSLFFWAAVYLTAKWKEDEVGIETSRSPPAAESVPHPEVTPLSFCTTQRGRKKGRVAVVWRQWFRVAPHGITPHKCIGHSLLSTSVSVYPDRVAMGFFTVCPGRDHIQIRGSIWAPCACSPKTFQLLMVKNWSFKLYWVWVWVWAHRLS